MEQNCAGSQGAKKTKVNVKLELDKIQRLMETNFWKGKIDCLERVSALVPHMATMSGKRLKFLMT